MHILYCMQNKIGCLALGDWIMARFLWDWLRKLCEANLEMIHPDVIVVLCATASMSYAVVPQKEALVLGKLWTLAAWEICKQLVNQSSTDPDIPLVRKLLIN